MAMSHKRRYTRRHPGEKLSPYRESLRRGIEPHTAWLWYIGRGGARIEIAHLRTNPRRPPRRWWVRFDTSQAWAGPFKTKQLAMLCASHSCGRSGMAMRWFVDPQCYAEIAADLETRRRRMAS